MKSSFKFLPCVLCPVVRDNAFLYTVLYTVRRLVCFGDSYCTVLVCCVFIMALSKPTRTWYKSLTLAEKIAIIWEVEQKKRIEI